MPIAICLATIVARRSERGCFAGFKVVIEVVEKRLDQMPMIVGVDRCRNIGVLRFYDIEGEPRRAYVRFEPSLLRPLLCLVGIVFSVIALFPRRDFSARFFLLDLGVKTVEQLLRFVGMKNYGHGWAPSSGC